MGPEQPTGTESTELTDDQIMEIAKSRGLSFSPEEALDTEGKVRAVQEAMGGPNFPEGLTDEQKAEAQAALDKDTQIAIYQAEKEASAVHPDLSENKKFEIAKAFLKGDLTQLLKLSQEANKAAAEADSQKSEGEQNLHVESESTGQSKQPDGKISNLGDVFGSGGMLSRIKKFGS